MRAPRPTDIVVQDKPRDFVLRDGNNYYLFCYDLPMTADINVELTGEGNLYVDRFAFTDKVKKITWLDNGAELKFEQSEDTLTVHTTPFVYGRQLVVRVAKIECE